MFQTALEFKFLSHGVDSGKCYCSQVLYCIVRAFGALYCADIGLALSFGKHDDVLY